MMKCAACHGEGCGQCREGMVEVTRCPLKHIDRRTSELMRFAGHARGGMWPVAGGALEQTSAFLTAESLIRSDRKAWRASQGLD